jgi:RHS repeat-associated protein
VAHSALPDASWNIIYGLIGGQYSRIIRIDDPFGRSCHFSYNAQGLLVNQEDMGGLKYSYEYTSKNSIDTSLPYSGQTAVNQLLIEKIHTPTGTTSILTEPADGIVTQNWHYTDEQLNYGYWMGYPPPGTPMWTNYRITVLDHINQPTEYFFCGYGNSFRYIRDALQLSQATSASGNIPNGHPRLQHEVLLVGGKGKITGMRSHTNNGAYTISSNFNYDSLVRLPNFAWAGSGKYHSITYNNKGRPLLVKLYNQTNEDYWIHYQYESNGIDIDQVRRKRNGVMKTLLDVDYHPGTRDIQYVKTIAFDAGTELTRTIQYSWKPNGQIESIADALSGDTIVFSYDGNFRLASVTLNGAVMSQTVFDEKGLLLSEADADQQFTIYEYDELNRITKVTGNDQSYVAYQWACCFIEQTRHGKMVNGSEKTLRRTFTQHDRRALPLRTVSTDGSEVIYEYEINGRLKKLRDQNGKSTEYLYDSFGRLSGKRYEDNTSESYTFDNYGKITTHKDRANQQIHYSYDSTFARLQSIYTYNHPLYPSYYDESISYDTWSNISQRRLYAYGGGNSVNHATNYQYDLLGRVISSDGPWTDDTITWTYHDPQRQVTRTSPGSLTDVTSMDQYGRLHSIANALGTFTNQYASVGGPLVSTLHTGANAGFDTHYTHHGAEMSRALASITSLKSGSVIARHTYQYDSLGQITEWKREAPLPNPTGATHQFTSRMHYSLADRLQSVVNTPLPGSSVPETAHHFSYDAAGNLITAQRETGSTASLRKYSVNALNQMTSASSSGEVLVRGNTNEPAKVRLRPSTSHPWLDARHLQDNVFEKEVPFTQGSNTLEVEAKDGNQNTSLYRYSLDLAAGSQTVHAYDSAGRVISDGVRSFAWDCFSRLISIDWGAGSGKTTHYRYNIAGQRSETLEKTNGTTTAHYRYLYDGLMPIARYNGGDTTAHIDRRYFPQGEQRKENDVWVSYYYCRDHLGSIREVLRGDGTLVARYDYDPYGLRQTRYNDASYGACDFGYTGHITQRSPVTGQTEIVLTRYRAYDPHHARWLSPDPLGEEGGLNLYEYCLGNPVNGIDPLGLENIGKELAFYVRSNKVYGPGGTPFCQMNHTALDRLNISQLQSLQRAAMVDSGRNSLNTIATQNTRLLASTAAVNRQGGLRVAIFGAGGAAGAATTISAIGAADVATAAAVVGTGAVTAACVGAAAVGGGVGYGISKIPTGADKNVGERIGDFMYWQHPWFFNFIAEHY